jgi:hypothetical protein
MWINARVAGENEFGKMPAGRSNQTDVWRRKTASSLKKLTKPFESHSFPREGDFVRTASRVKLMPPRDMHRRNSAAITDC